MHLSTLSSKGRQDGKAYLKCSSHDFHQLLFHGKYTHRVVDQTVWFNHCWNVKIQQFLTFYCICSISLSSYKNSCMSLPFNTFSSVQFSSVAQLCPTLCDPMNPSTPGLPVRHQLPEFTQTHVHRVSDAIQPSHPLSSPSPPAPNPSQHQSLFQWVNSSHEVAKVLELQL